MKIQPHNKAVLYARVSSKDQEQEGYSIPAQLKLLKEYALKEGFEVAREFVDVETAKQAGRASFGEMVRFLRSERITGVLLVEKTDRLYRNFRDYVTIDDLMQEGLSVHLVKEGEVLSKDARSHQKFIHGIKVLLAKNYIDNLSEETSKGLREKAEQGFFPSVAPLGYMNVLCGDRRFIQPDPKIAPLIRKLYEWYATGNYSELEVTRMAQAEGLAYRRSGNKIHKSVVGNILHNPIYHGEFFWKGKLYQGKHEPIISRDLYDRVQAVYASRAGYRTKLRKYQWAFRGMVSCGHCGCAMVAELKKGRYIYYHCTGHKGRCGEPYVREEELAKQFGDALLRIRLDPEVLSWLKEAMQSSMTEERDYHGEAIHKLQDDYKRLQDRLDALYVDKLDGKVDEGTFLRLSERWRGEQEDLRKTLERHEKANRSYVDAGVQLLELAAKAHALYSQQPMLQRRRLLNYVFSNSTWKDGRLTPVFRQPFDMLANANASCEEKKAADKGASGLSEKYLPERHSHPTLGSRSASIYTPTGPGMENSVSPLTPMRYP